MDAPAEGEHKGLLRSTPCMGGWPLVWAVQAQEVLLLQGMSRLRRCLSCSPCTWRASRREAQSRREHRSLTRARVDFWSTQAPATPKYLQGKNSAIWKKPSEVSSWLLRSLAGVWKARSQLIQLGLHGSTAQWIPFNPANILSWKGDCGDFLQTQTSPCTFYNQIPYLDLAQHKVT